MGLRTLPLPTMLLLALAALAAPVPMCYTWNTPEWLAATTKRHGNFTDSEEYILSHLDESVGPSGQCCMSCYNGLLLETWYYVTLDVHTGMVSVQSSLSSSPPPFDAAEAARASTAAATMIAAAGGYGRADRQSGDRDQAAAATAPEPPVSVPGLSSRRCRPLCCP